MGRFRYTRSSCRAVVTSGDEYLLALSFGGGKKIIQYWTGVEQFPRAGVKLWMPLKPGDVAIPTHANGFDNAIAFRNRLHLGIPSQPLDRLMVNAVDKVVASVAV